MPHVPSAPFSLVGLDPEEAEAAIALGIGFASVEVEALSDGGLHLGHGASGVEIDVGRDPVAAMHDERAVVHALL